MASCAALFRSVILCTGLVILTGTTLACGDSGKTSNVATPTSNNSPTVATAKTQTIAETPEISLNTMFNTASTSAYTVEVIDVARSSLGPPTKYTQKGYNFRIDTYPDDDNPSCAVYAFYNVTRKQVASVGGIGRVNNTCDPSKTSGWYRADSNQESHGPIVKNAIIRSLRIYALPSDLIVGLNKQGDTFSFKLNYNTGNEDITYHLECRGPKGLPTKLTKNTAAYGANPAKTEILLELMYTNFESVPDSMFEIPGGLVTDTRISSGQGMLNDDLNMP